MMEIGNKNEKEDHSDERIFEEMKNIFQDKSKKRLFEEPQIQENVRGFSTNYNEVEVESTRNDIEFVHKYSSDGSHMEGSPDIKFELLDPDNLTEMNESDGQSCIEELDNIVFVNYERENLEERDFWDCPYCPYKANQMDFIHKHIVKTHASVTCYKCQQCQYAHPQLSLVMSHVNRRHQKIKYQCPECKCKFTTIWNCEGHILIRHPKKAPKLLQLIMEKNKLDGNNRRCPFCKFTDYSSVVLKRHVERTHSEVITFKCLYCTYKSIDTDDLADHMKDMHPEESEDIDI